MPKWCPYVWGCEKECRNSFLYDNEFGVAIYACTGPKHGSGDKREQRKELTPDDIANMFVGVPHAVNQRDTPHPIRKIPVNGGSRVQKLEHPVVDVAINEQCHRVLTMPLGIAQHIEEIQELLVLTYTGLIYA